MNPQIVNNHLYRAARSPFFVSCERRIRLRRLWKALFLKSKILLQSIFCRVFGLQLTLKRSDLILESGDLLCTVVVTLDGLSGPSNKSDIYGYAPPSAIQGVRTIPVALMTHKNQRQQSGERPVFEDLLVLP